MYCSKCGKEIPNESVFCPECGNKCKGSSKSIPIDVNEHKGYIIKSLCHPITSVKEHVFGVSSKIQLIYIAIITLIIPLVKTLLFKAFSFNLVKSVVGIILEFSNINTWDFNNMIKAKSQFDMIMENVFPTGNIYFLNLGSYIINYALILGIIYIIFKFLVKEDINKDSLVNIMFVVSIINVFILIISSIALVLGGAIWMIVSIFSSILSVVLLYALFNTLIKSKNKFIYIYSLTCMVVYSINAWFVFNNVSSIIYQIYYNLERYFI